MTGSHLDSVPDGGGFDGALGVVTALAAVDLLQEKSFHPERSVVLAVFTEEEGARFGVPCLGSRLLTGAIDPDAARALTDTGGITLAEAMAAAGHDPACSAPATTCWRTSARSSNCTSSRAARWPPWAPPSAWPKASGRTAGGGSTFEGRADHAGTAQLADRRDPMLPYAHAPSSPPGPPPRSMARWPRSAR